MVETHSYKLSPLGPALKNKTRCQVVTFGHKVETYLQFGGGSRVISANSFCILESKWKVDDLKCQLGCWTSNLPFGWCAEGFWHLGVGFSFFGFFYRWSNCGCCVGGRLRRRWGCCIPVSLSLTTAAIRALLVLDSIAGWRTCSRCGHGAADNVMRSPDQASV